MNDLYINLQVLGFIYFVYKLKVKVYTLIIRLLKKRQVTINMSLRTS